MPSDYDDLFDCIHCDGTGSDPHVSNSSCEECSGSGTVLAADRYDDSYDWHPIESFEDLLQARY